VLVAGDVQGNDTRLARALEWRPDMERDRHGPARLDARSTPAARNPGEIDADDRVHAPSLESRAL